MKNIEKYCRQYSGNVIVISMVRSEKEYGGKNMLVIWDDNTELING